MNVLFVCLHNAGRSQMAEALLARASGGRHAGRSAGSTPADRVYPEVVEAMRELGDDLAGRVPRSLAREDAEWADVVVTMGCGDACPVLPGRRSLDWELPDPKGRPLAEVRAIRDEVRRRVEALVAELDAVTPGRSPAAGAASASGGRRTRSRRSGRRGRARRGRRAARA